MYQLFALSSCLIEDPSTRRQLPRNYVQTLEERLEVLEGLLQQQQQRGQSQAETVEPPQRSQSHIHDYANTPTTRSVASENDDPEGSDNLVSKAGVLSLHASGAEPHYFGHSSMFSFSRIIRSCVRQVGQGRSDEQFESALGGAGSSSISPCNLPDLGVGLILSNAYFENIHLQYPFLHEPTFRQWENNAHGIGTQVTNSMELFFVNIVYSVGSLLKPNTGTLSQQLYASALLYFDDVIAQKNIESIQAVLCCAMFSLRSTVGPSTWNLSGLALRQCIELGYHRNFKKANPITNTLQSEMKKRVFWCAYQIDCASSVNVGLPLSLPIEEVDTEFPLDINDSAISNEGIGEAPRQSRLDPVTTVTHALHQFRIRCIWARIYAALYTNAAIKRHNKESYEAQIKSLRSELDNWMSLTPPEPHRAGPTLCVFASTEDYKITYNETIILLYRGKLTRAKDNPPDDIFLECMQAASSICDSCKRLYVGKPINYTWSALHVLFLAGLTYLHCLWASPTCRQAARYDKASNTFTNCTMLLAIMAEHWAGAAPYRDLFQALASRTMTMIVEQGQDASPVFTAPSPNTEELTQWAAQIADLSMPDAFGTLLTSLIGDYNQEGYGF
ncbi:hypothetical protein BU24DRAFT_414547 [Aaosphaeria arxii CBS 175.79]|uniref:Xylanolytic transcriptional activator regulatory domain-containing protein n=1 Tax=Aaosphaeria arxii CBS 175.79 TaxID=1450172 RepID=A0A6A5XAZ6_9PLEO|nr:uncharacterized protein BU24DRAFT_414547 [Aaosphaeria arxii CBS 175.79]KAF2010111.1 hypothetical protein BU24DRAFT_414547 [Aaosphaeria arxii CBS 175.79]